MIEFRKYKLRELASVDISSVDKKTKEGEFPVRLCNFTDVYKNWAIRSHMYDSFMKATAKQKDIDKFSIKKGQVAITKDSETRDDIGIPTYIADDFNDVVLGYHCVLITPHENFCGAYLNAYLNSKMAKKYFEGYASGSGQRYTLTLDSINEIQIWAPEKKEDQERIVKVLNDIDQKIILNTRMNAELEAMAKQLYDYWFVQFDFPDENGKPYQSSGGKMVWNEKLKREIPEGWEMKEIGEYIATERGISYSTPNISTGEGVPMLNLATFTPGGGGYKASGLKFFLGEYPKNKTLKPYDLIMCNTQQTAIRFETDIIGRAMLVPDVFDEDIVFSHHVNVIKPTEENLKFFLLYLFNSDHFHRYISGYTNGTNILGLSFVGINKYKSEIPPSKILDDFASVILAKEKQINNLEIENQRLTHLRDSLLPMLMNGQVEVKM